MREVVGSGNYKMAVAMVRVANALCDVCDSHDPMVAAAATHCNRSHSCWGEAG
jgi:hypothetical protein